jgi:hypothetical protein
MRRRYLLAAAAAALYLIGLVVTSELRAPESAPILDGLSPPPPYRWVQPPSGLAATNKKPFNGTFSLKFTKGTSEAGAFTTRDSQLSMILDPGGVPARPSSSTAQVAITPEAPSSVSQPEGYQIDGNVYRIAIRERPSGSEVRTFAKPQRVILVYPADKSFVKPRHVIAASKDGKRWTVIHTEDSTVQQQASGLISSPGFVAVVVPLRNKSSNTKIVGLAVASVAILATLGIVGWRRYKTSK